MEYLQHIIVILESYTHINITLLYMRLGTLIRSFITSNINLHKKHENLDQKLCVFAQYAITNYISCNMNFIFKKI